MKRAAILGLQWGQEGKEALSFLLSQDADIFIKAQGEGETKSLSVDGKVFTYSYLPSGVFNPDAMVIIGPGCLLDMDELLEEIKRLRTGFHLEADNIFIDERVNLLMPYHRDLGGAREAKSDRICGLALKACDLLDEKNLRTRLEKILKTRNQDLENKGFRHYSIESLLEKARIWRGELANYIIDTLPVVRDAVESDQNILIEMDGGAMEDIIYGTYPEIKSYDALLSGAAKGAGIPAGRIDKVIGVLKPYYEIKGSAPMVCSMQDDVKGRMGRKDSRIGWLDLLQIDYASYLNGVSELALMGLEDLKDVDRIHVSTGYMIEGEYYSYLPEERLYEKSRPIYETIPGWKRSIRGVSSYQELPESLKDLVSRIEEVTGRRISYVETPDGFIVR